MKPNTPNSYNGEEKAFIFESDLEGNNQCYYNILPDKKANGCFANTLAFGKSDIRFGFGGDILEGNFGYPGTFFECPATTKMPLWLGCT